MKEDCHSTGKLSAAENVDCLLSKYAGPLASFATITAPDFDYVMNLLFPSTSPSSLFGYFRMCSAVVYSGINPIF